MSEEQHHLLDVWTKRQELFSQCYEQQVFLRDADQRDGWISTQEAFLSTKDLGVGILYAVLIHIYMCSVFITFNVWQAD